MLHEQEGLAEVKQEKGDRLEIYGATVNRWD